MTGIYLSFAAVAWHPHLYILIFGIIIVQSGGIVWSNRHGWFRGDYRSQFARFLGRWIEWFVFGKCLDRGASKWQYGSGDNVRGIFRFVGFPSGPWYPIDQTIGSPRASASRYPTHVVIHTVYRLFHDQWREQWRRRSQSCIKDRLWCVW